MTREEYNELRARAHEQMLEDYKWMLDQESGIREWRCPKRWIIEFVHDVSDYVMVRSSGEEDVGDEWHDDLLRPIPLQKLYRQFFLKSCIPPPNHPDKALSKLRGMEQRNSIYPDSITRFYMEQLQKNPPCRIIQLLIMGGEES